MTVRLVAGDVDTAQVNCALRQLDRRIEEVARTTGGAAQPINITDLAREVAAFINVSSPPGGSIGALTFGVPPVATGLVINEGSSLSASRADHVHTFGVYGCRVGKSAETIADSTAVDISWTSETFDTDTMHDNAVNPQRITFTHGGDYIVGCYIAWTANATGRRRVDIFHNNSASVLQSEIAGSGWMTITTGAPTLQAVTGIQRVSAGDYAVFNVIQTSGGALDIVFGNAWAYRLGGP